MSICKPNLVNQTLGTQRNVRDASSVPEVSSSKTPPPPPPNTYYVSEINHNKIIQFITSTGIGFILLSFKNLRELSSLRFLFYSRVIFHNILPRSEVKMYTLCFY